MTDRMRRVNEALREVLSEGDRELKDPRIGFVTVTGVRREPGSPPGDRLRERARIGAEARRDARRPAVVARRPPEPRERASSVSSGPHNLTFEYDPTVERGVRLSRLIDELNADEHRLKADLREVADGAPRATTASSSRPTRIPTATPSGRFSPRRSRSTQLGKDADMYLYGEVPMPNEYDVHGSRGASARA